MEHALEANDALIFCFPYAFFETQMKLFKKSETARVYKLSRSTAQLF